ncbi:RING-type E3 ubiquitin transferase [Trifolium repens]|nr:RING-type E3 ubiquitin transferase [Trifolium repens]
MGDYTSKVVNSDSWMISDPRVFDCCNCLEFLTTPIFECDNGHIFCSTCHSKFGNKCQKCSMDITLKRSRAIENLLQSIKFSCMNEKHGCKERINYNGMRKHEEECIYVPCYCPLLGCKFVASSKVLSNHFRQKHADSRIQFLYDSPFFVTLKSNEGAIILQEQNVGKLFVLNNSTLTVGNAVNICCIGPNSFESKHNYDILAMSPTCKLKLQSFVKNVQQFTFKAPSSEFLVISFGSSESQKLEICITTYVMQINLLRSSGRRFPLTVKSSDTIIDVKKKIHEEEDVPFY